MGNTPTSVGKTRKFIVVRHEARKHPHERGEDRTPELDYGDWVGNTPTSVGKTLAGLSTGTPQRKHPHERGEDEEMIERVCEAKETPPRAWGRLSCQ